MNAQHLRCVLESPVAVEQRVCVRIVRHRSVKHLIDQSIIVAVPDDRRNNPAVAQIKNSADTIS